MCLLTFSHGVVRCCCCCCRRQIADIYCCACQTQLGWRYVRGSPVARARARTLTYAHAAGGAQEEAFEESQKYKEGKVILEEATITKLRRA